VRGAAVGVLFPSLHAPPAGDATTVSVGHDSLTRYELAQLAGGLAGRLPASARVAVHATASIDTVVAVVGALAAGSAAVMINPSATARELDHVLGDSRPRCVIAAAETALPEPLARLPRVSAVGATGHYREPFADAPERAALIIYTSGTTGPPKGVCIPRRAIASNLDALASAWAWTPDDRLAHALPLFHVHGLVLGILGPLRVGCSVAHLGRFSAAATAAALDGGATMVFGVPTMYHRLADACETDGTIAQALAGARLLVSGSAALALRDHNRIAMLAGQRVIERYGMTETLINTSVRAEDDAHPGTVGTALEHVEVGLLDDDGRTIETEDDETIGEIVVRGPNLFTGYLNQPDSTASSFRDGWFLTGDLATRGPGGIVRIVGRRSTDLIKSGGFKIGAGEVESALLEHPSVAEVAVAGEFDADLGERVVAWVVLRDQTPVSAADLVTHAASLLAPHKLPREVRFLSELPRNAMGKVQKAALRDTAPSA